MPSFILRDLNPEFWSQVQAKATREGITIKALILRLLSQWLAAAVVLLLTVSCGYHAPNAPTPSAPIDETVPYTLSLGATVGFGPDAGHATVNAKVQNVKGAPMAGVSVAFLTDVGEFSATPVSTGPDGLATTTITASSTAAIVATAGTLTTKTLVTSQPVPPPPTQPAPPILPPPPPPPPGPGPLTVTLATNGAVTVGTQTLFTANVAGGSAVRSVAWTFGDNTTFFGASTTTGHTYAAVGSYPAGVIVTDTGGRSATANATATVTAVPPPPAPSYAVTLTVSPSPVVSGTSATLTASVTPQNGAGAATTYAWDCGDGVIVTSATATQICPYTAIGTVTARVTVTGGTASGSASTQVTVTAQPTPVVTVSCAQPTPPALAVHCVVSATLNGFPVGSSGITNVNWDLGDSFTTTTVNNVVDHTYLGPATYSVIASNITVTGTTQKGSGSTSIAAR